MKRCLLALVTGIVLAILVLGASCQREIPDTPKMTAPEVCQYVNEALPDEHMYLRKADRLELRYHALSAQYVKPVVPATEIRELCARLKGLSSADLDWYKRELRQRINESSPQDQVRLVSRIRAISELGDFLRDFVQELEDEYPFAVQHWKVKVGVTAERQHREFDWQQGRHVDEWSIDPRFKTVTSEQYYYFCEATGQLVKAD